MKNAALALAFLVSAFIGFRYYSGPVLGAALPQAVAVFETSLASPITSSATTMTLAANAVRGGGALTGFNCFTVDEGSAQAETICGTVSATTVSGLTRGVSQSTGTTTVAALQFSHRRGANVKISDFPLIQIVKAILNGEDTLPNNLHFVSTRSGIGSDLTAVPDVNYVNSVAVSGAANASQTVKGIAEIATGVESASSTDTGGTGAVLVLPSSVATDTPNTNTRASRVLVTDLTGFLKQGWLNLTSDFITSGAWTFAASIAKPITFNALSYVWPSSHVAGALLKDDGSGNLSWGAPARYVSATTTTGVGFTHNGTQYGTSTALQFPSGAITASSTIEITVGASCTWSGGFTEQTYVQIQDQNGAVLATSNDFCGSTGASGNHNGWATFRLIPSQLAYTVFGTTNWTPFEMNAVGSLPSTMTTTTKLYVVLQGVANAANMISNLNNFTMIVNP